MDVGRPIAVAGVGVEEEAGRAGAADAAGGAGALDEILAVVGDADGLSGSGAFAGLRLGLGLGGLGVGVGVAAGGLGGFGSGRRGFDGDTALEEDIDDGGEERVFALAAEAALEVIEIQSPDHATSESLRGMTMTG